MAEKKTTTAGSARRRTAAKATKPRSPAAPKPKQGAVAPGLPVAQAEHVAFDLGDALTIREVEQLYERLAGLLDQTGVQMLDGGAVENIDAAGLQLLAVLMREAGSRSLEIGWSGASDTLRQAAQQLGVAALLQLDAVDQAA